MKNWRCAFSPWKNTIHIKWCGICKDMFCMDGDTFIQNMQGHNSYLYHVHLPCVHLKNVRNVSNSSFTKKCLTDDRNLNVSLQKIIPVRRRITHKKQVCKTSTLTISNLIIGESSWDKLNWFVLLVQMGCVSRDCGNVTWNWLNNVVLMCWWQIL